MKRPAVAVQQPPSTPRTAPRLPPPGLYFPSIRGSGEASSFDRDHAPSLPLLHQRYRYIENEPTALGLECFATSVAQANEIKILDQFFDGNAAKSLAQKVSPPLAIREFKLLTKRRQNAAAVQAIIRDSLNQAAHRPWACPSVLVKAYEGTKYEKRLHDRFAVLDDELWHFGATVGGSHPALSACSRGWSDEDVGFSVLFDQIWDSC